MSVKHFCDRCGRETYRDKLGTISTSGADGVPVLNNDACPLCRADLLQWWREGKVAKQAALNSLDATQLGTVEHLRILLAGMDDTNSVYACTGGRFYRMADGHVSDGHTTGEARDGTLVEQDSEPSLMLDLEDV